MTKVLENPEESKPEEEVSLPRQIVQMGTDYPKGVPEKYKK